MTVQVQLADGEYRIGGDWDGSRGGERVPGSSGGPGVPPRQPLRAYAFDVANLARFLGGGEDRAVSRWSRWTSSPGWTGRVRGHRQRSRGWSGSSLVAMRPLTVAFFTINRRVAAVRGVLRVLGDERGPGGSEPGSGRPSPPGLRPATRRAAGPSGPGPPAGWRPTGAEHRRLPESLPSDVSAFLAACAPIGIGRSCWPCCGRAPLGRGPRPSARRCGHGTAQAADRRQGRPGAGVPVDPAFFAELAAYLRQERPAGSHPRVSWCCADRPPGRR